MELKQIEKEIKELQGDMKLSYRRTVDDAIKIGELLKDAKEQLDHGDFMPWCERQGLNRGNSQRYIQLAEYKPKIHNMCNLDQAYQLIESEENKRKREEFEKQSERIHIFKKTGEKPDGWNESTDAYRLKKEQEDSEYEERKRKAFEERQKKFEEKKYSENIDTEQLLNEAAKLTGAFEEKERILSKMRLTGNNSKEPIYDALFEYLIALNENQRLEACHNIIKFCKGIAAECQKKSVRN